MTEKKKPSKKRNVIAEQMIKRTGNHAGAHGNREHDIEKGRSRKQKHKRPPETEGLASD